MSSETREMITPDSQNLSTAGQKRRDARLGVLPRVHRAMLEDEAAERTDPGRSQERRLRRARRRR